MTGDYKIILPLMIACVISTLVVRRLSKDSIYTLKLSRRGIDISNIKKQDLMDRILVSDAMFKKVITVSESSPVRSAGLMIKATTHRGFPVLDKEGSLVGIVTHEDINQAMDNGKGDIPVKEIMTKDLIYCYPNDSLKLAFEKLGESDIGRIPVVEHNDHHHLIGLITRKGIIEAYNYELKNETDVVT